MMKYIPTAILLGVAQQLTDPAPWRDIPIWAWFECAKWGVEPTPENVTKWWAEYQERDL